MGSARWLLLLLPFVRSSAHFNSITYELRISNLRLVLRKKRRRDEKEKKENAKLLLCVNENKKRSTGEKERKGKKKKRDYFRSSFICYLKWRP